MKYDSYDFSGGARDVPMKYGPIAPPSSKVSQVQPLLAIKKFGSAEIRTRDLQGELGTSLNDGSRDKPDKSCITCMFFSPRFIF